MRYGFLCLLLVTACGPTRFVRADGADANQARDVYACRVEAERLGEPNGGESAIGPAIATTIAKRRFFRVCMAARGWRPE